MRLTTRLMQIASWLLLQRAVNEGEMTQEEASSDKRRTRISWQQAPQAVQPSAALPDRLVQLIETSRRLQERIARLDGLISDPTPRPGDFRDGEPIRAANVEAAGCFRRLTWRQAAGRSRQPHANVSCGRHKQ